MRVRLAYFVTHAIQYQAPLLGYLSRSEEIKLQVFFLSDFSIHKHYEQEFNQTFKWDVALTHDYDWEVLPRLLIGPSTPLRPWWPVGSLRKRLREGKFDAVWVHGWGHVGLCQAIHEAASLGLPVLLRGESILDSRTIAPWRQHLHRKFLQRLFQRVSGFLCIGSRNREFYRHFGLTENRLFSMPYAVDNMFFQERCREATAQREKFRNSLGLDPKRPVILFAGKFITVKAPQDLLAAWLYVQKDWPGGQPPYLLFVGDGPLRPKLETQAREHRGAGVRFLGFRNQTELPALYDLCDVFILPSHFEPWGLVVNEVMNAGRPVIVSDRVGAARDLVVNGKNGFVYPSGDVQSLALRLRKILESTSLRSQMGDESLNRINSWDFDADRKGLLAALSAALNRRPDLDLQA